MALEAQRDWRYDPSPPPYVPALTLAPPTRTPRQVVLPEAQYFPMVRRAANARRTLMAEAWPGDIPSSHSPGDHPDTLSDEVREAMRQWDQREPSSDAEECPTISEPAAECRDNSSGADDAASMPPPDEDEGQGGTR